MVSLSNQVRSSAPVSVTSYILVREYQFLQKEHNLFLIKYKPYGRSS